MEVKIKRLYKEFMDLPLPSYQTHGSAGMDIVAAIENKLILPSGKVVLVPTGFAVAIPDGYECQVRPRSGLAIKNGIFVLNSPGTIDSDYRGEIKIILANFSETDFIINRGDRIAQLVISKYEKISFKIVEEFEINTERGCGGFGSSGV